MNRVSIPFLSGRCHLLLIYSRSISNQSNIKYQGVRETFDENKARIYFDRWLKSLWFAPGHWIQSTKDDAITVTRRYIPFWNYSLHGSIDSSVRILYRKASRHKNGLLASQEWTSVALKINNLSLDDVNIYASQTLDRYHLNQLKISFANQKITNLIDKEKSIEEWTVDKETAFQIGWDLNLIPKIQSILDRRANQIYRGTNGCRPESFHFSIYSKSERLLYYPIYIVSYQYGSNENFTCLIDGMTGEVTGDRQYSMTKVTLTTLIAFYPLSLLTLSTLGSFIDPSIGVALASLLSFKTSILLGLFISPIVGVLAKHYPKFYRQQVNQQQWDKYRSNSGQFTYDFTSSFHQQYQSYRQQQSSQRESKTEEEKEESVMDFYRLLSIDRQATDKEIKRAYLLKAKELHPDRNPGNKKAEELFKKVNQAYAILSDRFKRQQYDQYGYESVKYS